MLKFEEYLSDFSQTVNLVDFLINLLVATLLAFALRTFYTRYGTTVANREKFANNFVPLALATMIVITVVQASLALSLGLVGALSIVRFRAAIKEPEELVYLFLTIAIGLVTGANKPLLAIISIVLVLLLLYLNHRLRSKNMRSRNTMYLNIRTQSRDLKKITTLLEKHLSHIELKRMDATENGLYLSFLTIADEIDQLASITEDFLEMDNTASISVIDQPELVL